MKFDAVLFDMDGTLIESESVYISYIRSRVKTLGVDFPQDLMLSQIGKDLRTTAPKTVERLGLQMTAGEYLEFLDLPSLFEQAEHYEISLMPGVRKTLNRFQGKLKMAVATGSPPQFIEAVMKRFSLSAYFEAAVSSVLLPQGKPAPDVYLEAAKRLNVPIKNCIVIDDAPAGVQAGKAAGAYVIAAESPWTKDFDFTGADFFCTSMDEACRHIEGIL